MAIPDLVRFRPTDHLLIVSAWIIACLVLFTSLGSAPLTDLDEGAFSEATREMMVRETWVSPWLLDEPRFDKPILIHWLQMAAFSITGFSSFGARLPSALMGLIWIGGISSWAYLIAGRVSPTLKGKAYGWAVLISATSLGIPAISRAATADATLNAFLVLSLLFIWRALWPKDSSETGKLWIRLAGACVGLGLLTKGPIAILVPGGASLIAVLTCGRFERWLRLTLDPLAWSIALVIAAPWYILQFQAQGMAFVEGFLGLHNLGRFISTMHGFSAGPLYYPAWILVATAPWTLPLLGSLTGTILPGRSAGILRSSELRLAWGVFIFVLVFFSFSATKLPHYGFYGLSGLIVIISIWLAVGPLDRSVILRVALLLTLLTLTLAGALVSFWFSPLAEGITDPYYREVLNDAADRLQGKQALFTVLGLTGVIGFVVGFSRWFPGGVAIIALALAIAVYGVIVPTIMQSLREPILRAGHLIQEYEADANRPRPARIITWRLTAPSLSFAARRVIPAGSPSVGDWVITKTHLLSELPKQETSAVYVLFEEVGISLIEIRAKQ